MLCCSAAHAVIIFHLQLSLADACRSCNRAVPRMTYSYNTFEAAGSVDSGDWPAATTRSYVLDSKTLTNTNFVAVPGPGAGGLRARNLEGALVAANEIGSMQQQFVRAQPSFFGSFQAYDPTRAGPVWAALFNQISTIKSVNTPDLDSLIPRQARGIEWSRAPPHSPPAQLAPVSGALRRQDGPGMPLSPSPHHPPVHRPLSPLRFLRFRRNNRTPPQVGELDGQYDVQIAADWASNVVGWSRPGRA